MEIAADFSVQRRLEYHTPRIDKTITKQGIIMLVQYDTLGRLEMKYTRNIPRIYWQLNEGNYLP